MVSSIKKLRISPKLFIIRKTIDLPIGRQSLPPLLTAEVNVSSLHIDDNYEKSLIKQLKDLARRHNVLSTEPIIIIEQMQSIQALLSVLRQKKRGALSTTTLATQGELQQKGRITSYGCSSKTLPSSTTKGKNYCLLPLPVFI